MGSDLADCLASGGRAVLSTVEIVSLHIRELIVLESCVAYLEEGPGPLPKVTLGVDHPHEPRSTTIHPQLILDSAGCSMSLLSVTAAMG